MTLRCSEDHGICLPSDRRNRKLMSCALAESAELMQQPKRNLNPVRKGFCQIAKTYILFLHIIL